MVFLAKQAPIELRRRWHHKPAAHRLHYGEAGYHKTTKRAGSKMHQKTSAQLPISMCWTSSIWRKENQIQRCNILPKHKKYIPLCPLDLYLGNGRDGVFSVEANRKQACRILMNLVCITPVSMAKTPFSRASMTSKYLRVVLLGTEGSKLGCQSK